MGKSRIGTLPEKAQHQPQWRSARGESDVWTDKEVELLLNIKLILTLLMLSRVAEWMYIHLQTRKKRS